MSCFVDWTDKIGRSHASINVLSRADDFEAQFADTLTLF